MMRVAETLLCCCVLLLAAGCSKQETGSVSSSTSGSVPADSSESALDPKIVLQIGHEAPVLAVHWVDEGRHLASLAGDGSMVFWDVETGAILDHAQIPLERQRLISSDGNPPTLRFHAFTEGTTADTLAVAYFAASEEEAKHACLSAHHPGTSLCTFTIDLATRLVSTDAGLSVPAGDAAHWPISPDGRLRPEPNHGNRHRGLPDTSDEQYFPVDPTCTSLQRCRYGVTLFAHEPGARPAPNAITQLVGHQSPVVAAQWRGTGRSLISLGSDGSIVSWDLPQRMISSRLQVPLDPRLLSPNGSNPPVLRLHAFAMGFDHRPVVVYAAASDAAAERACPDAHRPGKPWCSYVVSFWPSEVLADPTSPIPPSTSSHWPVSPDGRLRLEANRGYGPAGSPNTRGELFGEVCTTAQPCRHGVTVLATGGGDVSQALLGGSRNYFLDADVSADGLRLLRVGEVYDAGNNRHTRVETLDMNGGVRTPVFETPRDYHHARWLDQDRYLLGSNGYDASNDTEDAMAGFPPARLIDPACALRGDCPAIESRWKMRASRGGAMVGLRSLEGPCFKAGRHGIDNVACNTVGDEGLMSRAVDARKWQPMKWALAGQSITAIEYSPDGRRLAVATRSRTLADTSDATQVVRLWRLDVADEGVTAQRELAEIVVPIDGEAINDLSFSADGRYIVFNLNAQARTGDGRTELYRIDADASTAMRRFPNASQRSVAIGNDRVLGLDDGALRDLDTGRTLAKIPRQAALIRAGWVERSRVMWVSTEDGRILFLDSGDGHLLLTLYLLPDNRYFAVTPQGRYDSNLGADSALVRWLVPDAPWQSLAGQTFMRDYYEPGLYRRLLGCRASDTCDQAFKPLPAIASLNRVLPQVRITGIRTGRDASEAVVRVEIREGVDADAPNGKTRSGIFNPRLFRNGRLVAMSPRQVATTDSDPIQWRKRNRVNTDDGVHRLEFTVPLPTQAGQEAQVFSAYAFNEDRIKGETVTRVWNRPTLTPRPRRAYVLAIGIDDYDTPRFRLNYAVADARLMASHLSSIPGYETRTVVLAAERRADGRRTRVDRATLTQVLSLLAGEGDREATLASLRQAGIDASALQAATPDDAVIVSFSGHGWANPQGDFYLIPGNGRWPEGSESPDLSTVFSTADLVTPFHAMQAGEITLVIDACHSAASVADGRFKPGPMGDSGLGQLAFDKGIRILAATQADDVALEDARLGQGLLTYALAVDGLGEGKADLDAQGGIRIDEWLAYAVQRLPSLANDARVGRISAASSGTRAITFHDLPANAPARRVQQPALFDFNPQPSTVLLREATR